MIRKVTVVLAALFMTGCAVQNSIPVEYKGQIVTGLNVNNNESVGVTKWQDKRSLAGGSDQFAEKAVMRTGPATIGITSGGTEFIRIADFVRDNFIRQLQSQGVNAVKIDVLPASSNQQLLKNIAQSNDVDIILSGELLSFDMNCHGAWTLECSRKVAVSLTMIDKNGEQFMIRELFDASMINNEGGGVMHSTLLDQITNTVMKEALEKAIIRTIEAVNQAA